MRALWMQRLSLALLTIALCGDWVLFEILRITVFQSSHEVYVIGGLSRSGIGSFHLWQPISYAFLHSGWTHLLMNAVLLLAVGSRLEWMVGFRSYGAVLLLGAMGGAASHLIFGSNVLVGGSGVVFAVLFCMTTLSPESKWLVPFPLSAKNLGRGLLSSMVILLLINPELGVPGLSRLGMALVDTGWAGLFRISHACHLGGAVAGYGCARWILRHRVSLESLQRDRARRED